MACGALRSVPALVPHGSRAALMGSSARPVCRRVHGQAKSVLEDVFGAQEQVLIPVAAALKEQLEEFVLERLKNVSIQAVDEYSHL